MAGFVKYLTGGRMRVEGLLKSYLTPMAYDIVHEHGLHVAAFAMQLADHCGVPERDRGFIREAAMLHDIGVCRVNAPDIGCFGTAPYLMHGVFGREILEREGFPLHALVCERHIGVGLTVTDIVASGLPLPQRDMVPETLAERLICCADLFFSKKPGQLALRKPIAKVRHGLERFGVDKVQIFDSWLAEFGIED